MSDTQPPLQLVVPPVEVQYDGALSDATVPPGDVSDDAPYDGPPILGPDGQPAPRLGDDAPVDMQVGIQIAEDGSGVAVKLGEFTHVFNSIALIDLGLLLAAAGMEAFKIHSAYLMRTLGQQQQQQRRQLAQATQATQATQPPQTTQQ